MSIQEWFWKSKFDGQKENGWMEGQMDAAYSLGPLSPRMIDNEWWVYSKLINKFILKHFKIGPEANIEISV